MVDKPPPSPVRSFSDVIDRGLTVVTWKDTSNHGILVNSAPGTDIYRIWTELMRDDPSTLIPDTATIKRRIMEEGVVYFGDSVDIVKNSDHKDFQAKVLIQCTPHFKYFAF